MGAICTLSSPQPSAQNSGFDFSTQRSEIQHVSKVPGEKKTGVEWIVNPTPHKMTIDNSRWIDISKGVWPRGKHEAFSENLNFMPQNKKGTKLNIECGAKPASRHDVKSISGAYALIIDKKGITIAGYDERGVFYGIQTLRQLLQNPTGAKGLLPYIEINDYPDMANRGVVEGFYGNPWTHEVRLSLIDFYGKFKMNSYLYGPKDDPYHSCPNWRQPYPEKEAANIRELIEACQRNHVDFVWAIHPGQDIKWNEEDYQNLKTKFNQMYELGVRHFAIFFDDISGEGTNPRKQTELLNRLTNDFVKTKGDVSPLTVCPTDYSKLWANPRPDGSLAIYGQTLEPDIKVFWTGDVVCSDLTPETLEFVNSRIRRPAFYWWNYPVTDYVRNYLLQGPVYGLSPSVANEVSGLVSNPMEHGEASKLALYGVADYTWNMEEYNPIDNWERGMGELVPDAQEAYRTFAIHSCDTETGYRRDESWETKTFSLSDWDEDDAESLEKEFTKIAEAPGILESDCKNELLIKELRPWLVEFGKLGIRGKKAIEAARLYRSGEDNAQFWEKYVESLMSKEERKNYEAHKSGTMKLQPFYENLMDDMGHGFLTKLLNDTPKDYRGISSFKNSGTVLPKLMLDNDTTTYYTSAKSQRANDWIGVDLRCPREVREISILQGRNSVNDVDYFDNAILECSVNGEEWQTLMDGVEKQYVIHWSGEPVMARYVRLRRLDSARKNYASVRTFDVNPLHPESLGFDVTAADVDKALRMFDQNIGSPYTMVSAVTFSVPTDTKGYTILMNKPARPLTCRFIDAGGKTVGETTLTKPFSTIELPNQDVEKVSLDGAAEIYEIIPNR